MFCFYIMAKLIFSFTFFSPLLYVFPLFLFPSLSIQCFPSPPPDLSASCYLLYLSVTHTFSFHFYFPLPRLAFSSVLTVMGECVSSDKAGLLQLWPAYHIKGCDGMIKQLRLSKRSFREQAKVCVHTALYSCVPTCIKADLKNVSSWKKNIPHICMHVLYMCQCIPLLYCMCVNIKETDYDMFFILTMLTAHSTHKRL